MDRIYLKSMAKEQIRDKIGVLFLCTIIIYAVSAICSMLPGAGGIASLILSPVLNFGLALNSLQISRGGEADVKLMGEGFTSGKFGKVWLTYFLVELYTMLWSLLFIIPGIVKAYSYIFAPYVLADNPDLTPREVIAKSKEMTYGHKLDLFVLTLSFLGWYLLVGITFGIAGIYVVPYVNTTMANAYNSIKGGAMNAEIYDAPEEESVKESEPANEPDEQILDTLSDN